NDHSELRFRQHLFCRTNWADMQWDAVRPLHSVGYACVSDSADSAHDWRRVDVGHGRHGDVVRLLLAQRDCGHPTTAPRREHGCSAQPRERLAGGHPPGPVTRGASPRWTELVAVMAFVACANSHTARAVDARSPTASLDSVEGVVRVTGVDALPQ